MKRRRLTILAAIAVGAILVAVSGIIPIKASSGHWKITNWILHFAMRRSVSTHTLGLNAPELDDPQLVLKGAPHYESSCRPCHGSPQDRPARIAQEMTPPPPELVRTIAEWEPAEIFYIVKHGVKFTGMPAWPAQQRDDEVWAIVAFLLTLPGLDTDRYRQLAGLGESSGQAAMPIPNLVDRETPSAVVIQSCARCHGVDGRGRAGAFPRLAGQRPAYLVAALQAYAHEERHSGIMQPVAASLSLETMRDLADYYARLQASPPSSPRPDVAVEIERGKQIAEHGIRHQRVPSCVDCHGPGAAPRNAFYPELAGQHADYLALQLELFKDNRRGGSAYAHLMRPVVSRLSVQQMRDVTLYYASLP